MSNTEMSKRSSEQFETETASKSPKWAELPTEDLEEAMFQVKKSAANGREHLVSQAKKHFEARNGFQPNSEELADVFNTLRDSMLDSEAAQSSSSDEEEEDAEEMEKMQNDIDSAFENVRDLGREAGKRMQAHLKTLWEKENDGTSPSKDDTDAVIYNLKHMVVGMVTVEDEGHTDDEDYKPSETEQQKADEEAESAEKETVAFDFQSSVEVSEEQFEGLVEKFIQEKGRSPTSEEADALLESFSKKFSSATFDEDDSDYEPEKEAESEAEEDLDEDKSLAEDMDVESEESAEGEFVVEPKSDAFQYMEELEEGSDEEQPNKAEQSEQAAQTEQVCA